MTQPWKQFQKRYNEIVTTHTDDASNFETKMHWDIPGTAIEFVTNKSPIAVYPGKSYIVGIIYATMLNKVYGVDVREALNDPELLYGQDPYFVPYSNDPVVYDDILKRLSELPFNWLESGWASQTVKYFYAECTEEGCAQAIVSYLETGVAVESE